MSKRQTPPAPSPADSVLREILESEDYKAALRGRMLAGKATAAEIALARDLGVAVPVQEKDELTRQAMRAMPRSVLSRWADICRMMDRPETAVRLRCIDAGSVVGIGYDASAVPVDQTTAAPTPEPPNDDDEDLMP